MNRPAAHPQALCDAPFPSWLDLAPLLTPRGIAVVGASADPDKFTGRIIPSLLRCGYGGALHPVNPRHQTLGGLPCHPSLTDVPDPCDLAIVAVPARQVLQVAREAQARGVGAAVILSSGFEEIEGEGPERALDLRALAAGGRLRLYGPNCPGLWQIRDRLVYTFSAQFDPEQLRAGPVGLVTQGGALGRAVLDAMEHGLGFSYWFSTGNEADLQASDFIALLAEDPGTQVVAAVLEGWREGARLLRAVDRCHRAGKPVVLLTIGGSAAGAEAARRHTGAGRGGAAVTMEDLRGAGCLIVDDIGELTDLLHLLARYPAPPAHPAGIGVCSFSGGAGGLLADHAAHAGAPLPPLGPEAAAALRELLPEIAGVGNPTDVTTAVFQDPTLACRALEIMAEDPGQSLLLFPLPHRHDAFDAVMAGALAEAAPRLGKPLAAVSLSPTFEREEAGRILREAGIPVLPSARRAALAAARWLRRPVRDEAAPAVLGTIRG